LILKPFSFFSVFFVGLKARPTRESCAYDALRSLVFHH
jgi:hypothetical protein